LLYTIGMCYSLSSLNSWIDKPCSSHNSSHLAYPYTTLSNNLRHTPHSQHSTHCYTWYSWLTMNICHNSSGTWHSDLWHRGRSRWDTNCSTGLCKACMWRCIKCSMRCWCTIGKGTGIGDSCGLWVKGSMLKGRLAGILIGWSRKSSLWRS
jgi:hypothetical protein